MNDEKVQTMADLADAFVLDASARYAYRQATGEAPGESKKCECGCETCGRGGDFGPCDCTDCYDCSWNGKDGNCGKALKS